MLLEALADQRSDFGGDEARDAVLHQALFIAQRCTDGEQIQRIE